MATNLYVEQKKGVNWVSWGVLLALLAAGYFVWKYMPVYETAWEVDKLLAEGVARGYHLNRQREPDRSQKLRTLLLDIRGKLPGAGVTDPGANVSIDDNGKLLVMRCRYTVVVDHAFGKQHVMVMERVAETDSKPKKWD